MNKCSRNRLDLYDKMFDSNNSKKSILARNLFVYFGFNHAWVEILTCE